MISIRAAINMLLKGESKGNDERNQSNERMRGK
jgi:hypothetical protein